MPPTTPALANIDDLLQQLRDAVHSERRQAEDAISTLVRTQTAQGLATRFLERDQPYKQHAELSSLVDAGLLHKASFIQKPPALLHFYKRLLFALDRQPDRILEIGVKGGGSTAFWKALFPSAVVVGMDIKLRPWLRSEPSADGVIYVEGDQTDVPRLTAIANQYGPFDIVIDDGSHISAHQETTLRALLPHVRDGGLYVVEDVHATRKKADAERQVDFGEDIWPDFVMALFQRLRSAPAPAPSTGCRLALDVVSRTGELIVGPRALALRVVSTEKVEDTETISHRDHGEQRSRK
jgi:cephalosporin hydroxylase